jgi:hypothetical protein
MDWALVSPWIVALIGGSGAVLTMKIQHKGRPEHALIDQLQEEVAALRTEKASEIAGMKKDIADLKAEQQKSKRREMIRDNYINKLRRHIEDGNPPPPPEWPEGLYD